MKKVERESFIKSFSLFSVSMGTLISIVFYTNYTKSMHTLDETIFSQMRICNYDLMCEKFKIDFVKSNLDEHYVLKEDKRGLYAHFPIVGSSKNLLEVLYNKENYENERNSIRNELLIEYFLTIFIMHLFAVFFSWFSLAPLRKSVRLTEEFVKDILHDFNTPLSTLRLNTSMLKREIKENKKLDRIEKSVHDVLALQSHLRSYLNNHKRQKEYFDLASVINEHVSLLEKNYPKLGFSVELRKCALHTNKDAFLRIIDNLLSNAVKYNKDKGNIRIIYDEKSNILEVQDTGKGIKEPSLVFTRFYKEQERGIGIGLNIVKKLCEELNIEISLKSNVGEGTSFYLNLHAVLAKKQER